MLLGVVVCGTASAAHAQVNYVRICDEGNVDVWVATVWSAKGFLTIGRNPDVLTHKGTGWKLIRSGSCEQVFRAADIWSDRAFFAVAYQDRAGTVGLDDFTPNRGSLFFPTRFSRSNAVFCVPWDQFSFTEDSRAEAGAWCGSGREQDGKWWVPVPFILQWDRMDGTQDDDSTYTLTIKPDAAARVAWAFPRSGNGGGSGNTVAPRSATTVPVIDQMVRAAVSAPSLDATVRGSVGAPSIGVAIIYKPSSVLKDSDKPKPGSQIVSVDLKFESPLALGDVVAVKAQSVALLVGQQAYPLDTLIVPTDSVGWVRFVFVIPKSSTAPYLRITGGNSATVLLHLQ